MYCINFSSKYGGFFWEAFLLSSLDENCSTSGSIAVFRAIWENMQVIGVFFHGVVKFILIDYGVSFIFSWLV